MKDAIEREKYLKSGMGKRYLKNRLKRFLSLTGFTLLEITISLLLLGIGIVGFLHLMGVGLQSSQRAGDITEAIFLAQTQMANFQNNRDSLEVGSDTFTGGQYEIKLSGLDPNLYFVKVEALDDEGRVIHTLITYLYKPD